MRRLAAAIAVFAWTDMAIAQSNVTTEDIVQGLGGGARPSPRSPVGLRRTFSPPGKTK